jgi:sterol desaturase/sphingolipid hydroxylase (fatty acid hydroxylase superfamily)
MEKNVKEYLAFKNGETRMPEHLAIRKGITGTLFSNKYLEFLARTGIFPPIVLHLLVSTTLFLYGIGTLNIPAIHGLLAFFGGIFFWTFAEYNVHRFLYHTESNSRFLLNLQHKAHGIHHQYPIDPARLAMPPIPGLLLSGVFFLIFWLINSTYVFVFFPGFMIGYLSYISIHYAQHRVKSPKYGPWKALWRHHHIHHYVDPYVAHGVSTRFWDFVFGTMPKKKRKKKI